MLGPSSISAGPKQNKYVVPSTCYLKVYEGLDGWGLLVPNIANCQKLNPLISS